LVEYNKRLKGKKALVRYCDPLPNLLLMLFSSVIVTKRTVSNVLLLEPNNEHMQKKCSHELAALMTATLF
jgi:hypothetical protein